MKKNSIISFALTVLTVVICLSACSGVKKLEELRITSADIVNITPNGLKGIRLDLHVGVDNPGTQVSLSEISCDIKHSGKILGKVAVDPFTLQARAEDTYELKADLRLGEGLTLFDAGRLLDKKAMDEVTADIQANVKLKSGVSKKLAFNDIPLKKLIETAKR